MKSLVRYALANGGTDTQVVIPNRFLGHGFAAGNPTCVMHGGSLLFNTRLVNYKKIVQTENADFIGTDRNQTYFLHKEGFVSRNVSFRLHGGEPHDIRETRYPDGDGSAYYKGFEDCRLVVWNGVLYAYGTRWDVGTGTGSICIYELGHNLEPVKCTVVKSPFGNVCEKNWAAIEDMPFWFVYMFNPMTVVRVDMENGECDIVKRAEPSKAYPEQYGIKGSTQVARLDDDGYVAIVHTTRESYSERGMCNISYLSAFIFMDNSLAITGMSPWFVFRTELCEFTCGLSVNDGILTIPYSQVDCTVNVVEMPLAALDGFFGCDESQCQPYGRDYIFGMASMYDRLEQVSTASVLYNYAAAMLDKYDDVRLESAAKAFAGMVCEFPNLVEPSFVQRVKGCVMKFIADHGVGKWLYFVLADISRFEGLYSERDRYIALGKKQCGADIYKMGAFINADYV